MNDRQLEDDLRALGEGEEPPFGWQTRVRARIGERQGGREPKRRGWLPLFAAAGALVAATLAFLIFSYRVPPAPAASFLSAEIVAGTSLRRGGEARPGDELRLVATLGKASPYAELRVYRDERELVLRCSDKPPCKRSQKGLSASVRLAAPGRYRSLLLVALRPLPSPAGEPEADTAAALDAGAEVETAADVEVR